MAQILEENPLRFDDRDTREPEQIVIDAVLKYNIKTLVVLYSGGKDSRVTVDVVEKAIRKLAAMGIFVEMELLYCYTGTGHPDNFKFVLETAEKHGWKLNIEWPQNNSEYPQIPYMNFLMEVGFPGKLMHSTIMRILKIESMERFMQKRLGDDVGIDSAAWRERVLQGGIWLVSGRGRKNSKRRMKKADKELKVRTEEELTAAVEWGLPFVKPLFNKTKKWTWSYLRGNNLEIPESYALIHHSMECNCGAQAKKGEIDEIKTWYRDLWTDLSILIEQFGGKHKVKDELGREYVKDFGWWGWFPKKKNGKLSKKQKQMKEYLQAMEALVCYDCSSR